MFSDTQFKPGIMLSVINYLCLYLCQRKFQHMGKSLIVSIMEGVGSSTAAKLGVSHSWEVRGCCKSMKDPSVFLFCVSLLPHQH